MDAGILFLGAAIMIVMGFLCHMESYISGGVVLMIIGAAVIIKI